MTRRHRIAAAGLMLFVAADCTRDKPIPPDASVWRSATRRDDVPHTIAQAEAFGARFPRATGEELVPAFVAQRNYTGDAARRCVDVGANDGARSGEFFVGEMHLYNRMMDMNAPKPEMMWQGVHRLASGDSARFRIRASKLDEPRTDMVFETPWLKLMEGRGTEDLERVGQGGRTTMRIRPRGKWLLVATLANDWGCFIVTV